ncbi:MAG: hypothetical protein EZS28_004039 [Streblomastix strix]|uniref:Inositol polyphosphate-related phosphatase domain-containing protein n=1 Tax=Streblomastix strix TaxID=222440 RepID=A0A5J4X1U6_9EUKA|nr:MAG: hypothetical protein EZS28_004039 [Streblomastix strix]
MRESFFDKLSQSCVPANQHDLCFFMGDLNFERLLTFDELNMERHYKRSFDEFEETRLTFGPTYRFNVGSHAFDTSHKMQLLA